VRRRLLSPVLALAAALALGAGCADDVSPGITVGDAKISVDDVLDEVAEWAGNEQSPFELGDGEGESYPMQGVDEVISRRIFSELINQEFEELDLRLAEGSSEEAIAALFQGNTEVADQVLGAFSEEFATSIVEDTARQLAVQAELGEEGFSAWITETLAETTIEVNPRFGRWDPEAQTVVGPEGPVDPVQPGFDVDSLEPSGQ
jgi:hypothetical protein